MFRAMTDEELADLIEVALARRPDRVAQLALGLAPEALRAQVVDAQEVLATLALEAAERDAARRAARADLGDAARAKTEERRSSSST